MEKKFKFSDKNAVSKIVYLTVIAILCISAIVIGIVAANSRKKTENNTENPPVSDGTDNGSGGSEDGKTEDNNTESGTENETQELVFVSPAVGTVIKSHSSTVPVFSNTLEEWRIHTGIDISTADGAEVLAVANGKVTGVYNDPMLGQTVEITHTDTHKSYYSNLSRDNLKCKIGDSVMTGDVIGYVGDTTISELADETHLHFELKVSGASVNPLDYISDESKLASLGIVSASNSDL